MNRVDLSNYIPTKLPDDWIRIGTDDPNAKEGWCSKCPGMIPVPGRIYGYAGPVCHCNWAGKKIEELNREELIDLLNQNS